LNTNISLDFISSIISKIEKMAKRQTKHCPNGCGYSTGSDNLRRHMRTCTPLVCTHCPHKSFRRTEAFTKHRNVCAVRHNNLDKLKATGIYLGRRKLSNSFLSGLQAGTYCQIKIKDANILGYDFKMCSLYKADWFSVCN
jgi:hypothetical protein